MAEGEGFRKVFVRNLSFYMQLNGKNQMDLMTDLNLSSSTVSSWCTGRKFPRMDKIQLLADYFRIDKSDLIEDRDELAAEADESKYAVDAAQRRLFSYYLRLNTAGKRKLIERADELVKLGYVSK